MNMNATSPVTTQQIEKTILINAPAITVWAALTEPTLMKQWMAEPEMALAIYKHVDFYWQVTLTLLKKLVEQPTPLASSNTNIR